MYLGIQIGAKGHILFDLQYKEFVLSRDVIFFESIFPYKHSNHASSTSHTPSFNSSYPTDIFDFPYIHDSHHSTALDQYNHDIPNTSPTTPNVHTPNTSSTKHTTSHSNSQHSHSNHSLVRASSPNLPDPNFHPRRFSRITHPPYSYKIIIAT